MGEEKGEKAREEEEGGGGGEPEGGEDVVPGVKGGFTYFTCFNMFFLQPVVEGGHRGHQDQDDHQDGHEKAVEAVHLASVNLALPSQQTFQPLLVSVPAL